MGVATGNRKSKQKIGWQIRQQLNSTTEQHTEHRVVQHKYQNEYYSSQYRHLMAVLDLYSQSVPFRRGLDSLIFGKENPPSTWSSKSSSSSKEPSTSLRRLLRLIMLKRRSPSIPVILTLFSSFTFSEQNVECSSSCRAVDPCRHNNRFKDKVPQLFCLYRTPLGWVGRSFLTLKVESTSKTELYTCATPSLLFFVAGHNALSTCFPDTVMHV